MGFYDREYLKGIALTTAILSLPALSPGLAWLFIVAPLPIIYFPIAQGFDRGFTIVLLSVLISFGIAFWAGTTPVVVVSLSMMPAGFVLARSLNQRQTILEAFTRGAIALGVTWIVAGVFISALNHVNLYQELLQQIDLALVGASDTYSKAKEIPLDVQIELQAAFARVREVTPKVFPGVLATVLVSIVWLNIMLANWMLTRKGVSAWGDVSQWRLPDNLVWAFIAAGIMLVVPGETNSLGLNLMIVMVTLYFMQGFEVFNYLCRKWSVPNPIRHLIIFFLVIQAYGFILLALLGLSDIWADFRKPKTVET